MKPHPFAQKLRQNVADWPWWAAGGAKLPLGWGNGRGETDNLQETTRTPSFETLISHCRGALTGNPPKALRTQMNQPGSHHSACPREFLYFLDQYAPFAWPSRARANFPCVRARIPAKTVYFLCLGQKYALCCLCFANTGYEGAMRNVVCSVRNV